MMLAGDQKAMIKRFLTFGILVVVLVGIFVPTHIAHAYLFQETVEGFFKSIGTILMFFSSIVLFICGVLFDVVVEYSIVNMARNIGDPAGVGGAISLAWATLRDIANMCFIFVLLFAAFKAMFQLNFGSIGTTIRNIIIVALLINFSLFFSKVVIDASNIVAIGFYNEIASESIDLPAPFGSIDGISPGYMNMLGIQTIYGSEILENMTGSLGEILVFGIISSIFMLITAVILLIAGIMFAARFIILIFLMILSPLAFIAYIIPGMRNQFEKWKSALIDQSFFAPLYFALTWVVFRLGTSLLGPLGGAELSTIASNPSGTMVLVVNFVLIIGFSIAALIFAKQMATRTAGFKMVAGGIGAGVMGTAAWAGRASVGRIGAATAENARLQKAAKEKTGFAGAGARLALYASKKVGSGSFDVRNAAIPTSVVGDAIQGTIGRTGFGKKLGLNDVNIPSVAVSSIVKDMDMLGKGGTKGYKETKAESEKRIHEREAAAAAGLAIAEAKKDVKNGAKADPNTPAGVAAIDAMEKALSKLSDKETETLVSSNRELLKSLNFANAISVKQLEALNKSDQFSETERSTLKGNRFREIENINDSAGLAAVRKRTTGIAPLTPDETVAAERVDKARKRTKDLSDSELEMIGPNYLDPTRTEGQEFISQLKAGQVETIIKNKSGKFSTTQRENVKNERIRPLMEALRGRRAADAQNIVRRADIKTKVSYMKDAGTPPIKIALHPDILPIYVPKMLQRMALHDDMSDDDIHTLRLAILGTTGRGAPGVSATTVNWLTDPDKGMIEFP